MTSLILKRAGQTFEGDKEDECGNPLALEDMTDDQLNKWKNIVESTDTESDLAQLILEQIKSEIRHRNIKKRLAIGDV